ncbi:MAG TPA: histidine--tRNA ligase [bacterium]|nr:histidine--tRNA ligase [bacterium]
MSKKTSFLNPKGMNDILPDQQKYWRYLINTFEEIAYYSGYLRIDTPMVEEMDLFIRTVGDTSDIVTKEFFVLEDKSASGRKMVLRPEFTAPIARSYIQNGLKSLPKPVKLFSTGPIFRYSRPQSGRLRQFHQLNLEQIGIDTACADAEIISMCWDFFSKIGLKDIELHINTIGNSASRKEITTLLINYFTPLKSKLCDDCQKRLQKNPLRVYDCKEKSCQKLVASAPQIIDSIDKKSKKFFFELLEYLDEVNIPYILNPKLVRGLDYYTDSVFEFIPIDGSPSLGGGGRYDDLYGLLGEQDTPAVGVALGLERIINKLLEQKVQIPELAKLVPDVFLIQLGDSAKKKCFQLLHNLRSHNLKISSSLSKKSISAQLKKADKQNARLAVIIGQKEAIDNTIIIRDMKNGVQDTVDFDRALNEISLRLGL